MLKIGCTVAESKTDAINTKNNLIKKFGFVDLDLNENTEVDIIIMLGGDGFALHMIHKFMHLNAKFYGLNYGHLGFLMNKKSLAENDNFYESIINAQQFVINPLLAKITDINGKIYEKLAINDISITRKTSQTAKLQIFVDDILRMPEMIGDGVLISTPIGSTAYNVSVGGPILPINCNLLAVTPISPFRPRYWRGAMLDNSSVIKIKNLNIESRPISVTADFNSVRDVVDVEIILQKNIQVTMLFDNDFLIKDRIMREQFMVYN